jgi:hypothetical protein
MVYFLAAIFVIGILVLVLKKSSLTVAPRRISASKQNAELIKVLLNLDEQPLEDLFKLYCEQFGEGPARYARQTYLKWKSGSVRPNKQTFRRFMVNLPKVMSFDLKCEVLRELREAYLAGDNYKLTVNTDDWKQSLLPLVEQLNEKTRVAELPQALQHRLAWLAEDDAQVANALLAKSQERQSLNALTFLEKEFANIEHLLDNAGGRGRVTHVLKLPTGTITLEIKRR